MTPKQIGIVTEERCKLFFLEKGYNVSVPIGDNAPYDFILDINNNLYKIQVKHARLEQSGAIHVELVKNVSTRTQLRTTGYHPREVDFFCTEYEGHCYLIPYVSQKYKTLRIDPPKNNQSANIQYAKDYEAEKMIVSLVSK